MKPDNYHRKLADQMLSYIDRIDDGIYSDEEGLRRVLKATLEQSAVQRDEALASQRKKRKLDLPPVVLPTVGVCAPAKVTPADGCDDWASHL